LQQFVQSQVVAGQYVDENQYIQTLIARACRSKDRLESLLIEGLESGEAEEMTAESWTEIRAEVRSKFGSAQS
jgi:antitoxin ParD1/3/4